ncbi:hypothetical protein KFL_004230080 [Klebsormidium nitens]|uniref:Root cap family protein n=1 Tax=Klebsormidium nitens TaxID=105231 RepID=A0A1Y1IBP9_KLENI|nr:hypothetical protein KFL_004230080 [Klebsormidium nitens]|eukprot:GAQ88385.1 hypothetical protein KFL_004230080 [Klebsormidium nitens]
MAPFNVVLSSPRTRLLLILAAASCLVQLAAGQEIGPFDCIICDDALLAGPCNFNYLKGPATCKAPGSFFCGKCPPTDSNGNPTPPDKDVDCACKMKCLPSVDGVSGNFYCECPTITPGAICSDPHFRGAYNTEYDFHGVPNRDFTLISYQDLNVNAHFIGQDGKATGFDGTWMSEIGILWNGADGRVQNLTASVHQGHIHGEENPFTFTVNGEQLSGASYESADVSIARVLGGKAFVISVPGHVSMHLAAEDHLNPVGNHIDMAVKKLNVTGFVHGVLGQTFAAARAAALRDAAAAVGTSARFDASDIVEGGDMDYVTSGLLSPDAHFNRFRTSARAGPDATAKSAVLSFESRKLLSVDLDILDKEELNVDVRAEFGEESGGVRVLVTHD